MGAAAAVPPLGAVGPPWAGDGTGWVRRGLPAGLARLAAAVAAWSAASSPDAVARDAVAPDAVSHDDVAPDALPPDLLASNARDARDAGGAGGTAAVPPGDGPGGGGPVEGGHREVWALVERARDGDGEAFGRLYDRYVDVVHRYIAYRVGDRTLAEDLTSETFLRALRRIGSVTYQGRDIGAWLVTIARNLVLDHVKAARTRLETATDDISLVGDRVDTGTAPATPEALVLDAWTSTRLMAAVDQLGAEQRECVLLRFVQGFSVTETAMVMGKNDGAVKALQHRAVRKLALLVGDLA